jgi:hypothetical protein
VVRVRYHSRIESELSTRDGEGRNRTGDTTVFSRVLYRLSYLAADESVAASRRVIAAERASGPE